MKQSCDAVFENGVFKPINVLPLSEGQKVTLIIEKQETAQNQDILRLAGEVYRGLSEPEIEAVEKIALNRNNFFMNHTRKQ